jgi:hypothetical protein
MSHVPLPSVPEKLLRCASSIHEDAFIPASVPVETFAFLHKLGTRCDHSEKPLGRFLLLVRASQLKDAVLQIVLPSGYHKLREELEGRQREKEEAVANEEYARARELRDATDAIKSRMSQFPTSITEIKPDHVLQAIANLGFDEPIRG